MSRHADYEINPLFLKRATVRSYDPDKKITLDQVNQLLEAARWAPSSFNAQPWRIIYALRGEGCWNELFSLLVPKNASWAENGGTLMLIGANTVIEYKGELHKNHAAAFDVGAACQNMALQAAAMDLGMAVIGGFDHARATQLAFQDSYKPLVMVVVGHVVDGAESSTERVAIDKFTRTTLL
jgi:nitroreductase